MTRLRTCAVVRRATPALALGLALAAPAGAAGLPEWVAAAVARPTPAWSGAASVLVLHDEQLVTVPASGRIRVEVRGALRVLSAKGSRRANCSAPFLRGSSEVVGLRAWVVRSERDVQRLGRGDGMEVALAGQQTLYSDIRAIVLSSPEARIGTVFAWEYVREEDPLLAQWIWFFRGEDPSLVSRVSLTLPAGLEPEARTFGADSLEPTRSGATGTWEMRDLPAMPSEPLSPDRWTDRASLALGVRAARPDTPAGRRFEGWPDLARWLSGLTDPQAAVGPELAARAAALAGGRRDTLERMRALARDVQGLNYVAIDLGLGRGWGYRPNAATEVLRLGYGDCKDKSNLLRALLAAAGHESWLVPVYYGSRDHVDERWTSPQQFNHCILAIRVPAGTRRPAVFEHPSLGTLLAFDPTDPLTAFGDLPAAEQGSLGLLIDPRSGGLVRLPVAAAEASRMGRRIEASLDEGGRLAARVVERSAGQAAAEEWGLRRRLSETEYRSVLERWLAAGGGSVNLASFRCAADSVEGRFELEASYEAPLFARSQGGRLMTFRAALVTPRMLLTLPDSARSQPVALTATCLAETVLVRLPEGFAVDELPAAVHARSDFGALDAEWSVSGGTLRFTHGWTIRPVTLPAGRCRDVRRMLADNLAVSRALVVLERR